MKSQIQDNYGCTLTVTAEGCSGVGGTWCTLSGWVVPLHFEGLSAAKELFLSNHPGTFWSDYVPEDVDWYRMNEIIRVDIVTDVDKISEISGNSYTCASVDPIVQFSDALRNHMNVDHAEDFKSVIKHYIGIIVDKVTFLSFDGLGMNLVCSRQGEDFKCRLPFTRPVESRKDIPVVFRGMIKEAAAANAAE